ncbi:hypothetical protein FPE53_25740 [Salmonella enterica subsp. enterica]|uniref:Uncharacterized protein n=1 Tax=Salmonella enterica TaxID=28901 RepID=A0A744KE34_SALER|nr:hypothetical protein [Salmonella enterica subsp. enterica serovar Aqua]HAF2609213.1 hypothetical protein [Salmonella enterica]
MDLLTPMRMPTLLKDKLSSRSTGIRYIDFKIKLPEDNNPAGLSTGQKLRTLVKIKSGHAFTLTSEIMCGVENNRKNQINLNLNLNLNLTPFFQTFSLCSYSGENEHSFWPVNTNSGGESTAG